MRRYFRLSKYNAIQIAWERWESLVGGISVKWTKLILLWNDWSQMIIEEYENEEEAKKKYKEFFKTVNLWDLTRIQQKYYDFYMEYFIENYSYPTLKEVSEGLNKSPSVVHSAVKKIRDKWYLTVKIF